MSMPSCLPLNRVVSRWPVTGQIKPASDTVVRATLLLPERPVRSSRWSSERADVSASTVDLARRP
jgi:hypothetical protein